MVDGCWGCQIGRVDGEGAGSLVGEWEKLRFSKSGRRSNHNGGGRSVLLSFKASRGGVSRGNTGIGEPSTRPSSTSNTFPP